MPKACCAVPDDGVDVVLQWQGKVHFGIILGWSVLAAMVLWFVVKNIAGDSPDVRACNLSSCYSVLGYALLPMVAFSVLSVLVPKCALPQHTHPLLSLLPPSPPFLVIGAGTSSRHWCAGVL